MTILRWIPNLLTVSRMFLAIPIALALFRGESLWAVLFLCIAGITDVLDGYLSREFHWRSSLGSWLDPMADKLIIITCLVVLTLKSEIPIWFFSVVFFRDFGLALGSLVFLRKGIKIRIRPLISGKLAVATQNTVILMVIFQEFWNPIHSLLVFAMALAVFLTLWSSFFYFKVMVGVVRRFEIDQDIGA